jgi:heptosyltransferase-1
MSAAKPLSILLVKTSAIGDVIQTFPVLDYLRKKFPGAAIDWVAEQGIVPLLRAHPQLDNVIEIQSKVWRKSPFCLQTRSQFCAFVRQLKQTEYDLLFDLQGNTKSALVTLSARAKTKVGFGWKSLKEKCNLLVTDERYSFPADMNIRLKYLGLVQEHFKDIEEFKAQGVRLKIGQEEKQRLDKICQDSGILYHARSGCVNLSVPKLMVCFGSKWPNKRLEPSVLEGFLKKIALRDAPFFIFIYADEEEKDLADRLASLFKESSACIGNLSLPLWQALMWEMDGVIAVDSAALHLCGTTKTPSFSVFGPSLASCYKPLEERHLAVQGACPYGRVFSLRCPILRTCSTGACIRKLQVDELFALYEKWSIYTRSTSKAPNRAELKAPGIELIGKGVVLT